MQPTEYRKPLEVRLEEARSHSENMLEGIANEAIHHAFSNDPKERLVGFTGASRTIIHLDGVESVEVILDNNGFAIVCNNNGLLTTIVIQGHSSSTPR